MTDGGPDTFTRDRLLWQEQVLADRGMTLLALHVALVIGQHLNRKTGEAWPSQARICELLEVSRRGVQGAIDQLVSRQHLKVIPAANRKGGNRYRPLLSGGVPFAADASDEPHDSSSHAHAGAHDGSAHAHDASHEDRPHAHAGAHDSSSHVHETAVLMRTPVRTNSLKKPSEGESLFPASETSSKRTPPRASKPTTSDAQFDEFWLQVPKAAGKADARRAYDKAILSGAVTHHEVMIGIGRYAAERQGEDSKFTKHPATWLNKGCWADAPSRPNGTAPQGGRSRRLDPHDYLQQRLEEIGDE